MTKEKINPKKDIFRCVSLYPKQICDGSFGYLSVTTWDDKLRTETVNRALDMFHRVQSGRYSFGWEICCDSFAPPVDMSFTVPCDLEVLLFLHVLFTGGVMDTDRGTVSCFPCTMVHSCDQSKYPVLAVHKGHILRVMWRLYSATAVNFKTAASIGQKLEQYVCTFDATKDRPFLKLSGMDAYLTDEQKRERGFMLIPMLWLDVIKYFFVYPNTYELRDIGHVLRQVFSGTLYKNKFCDSVRAIWLGEERDINIMAMLRSQSMLKLRALDKQVRIGKNGRLWICPETHERIRYTEDSFAYGVQCWTTQLGRLNTLYAYLTHTHSTALPVSHMKGILYLVPLPVHNRDDCVRAGIVDDSVKHKVCASIRSSRRQIINTYGREYLATYWGVQKTLFKKD